MDLHPNGKSLATGGGGGKMGNRYLCIWQMQPIRDSSVDVGEPVFVSGHNATVNCVRWSHSGAKLASAADDGAVIIVNDGAYTTTQVHLKHHKDAVTHVDWIRDDTRIATASVDRTIVVWAVEAAQGASHVLCVLLGHSDVVGGCAWLRDTHIVSQSSDKTLRLWDVALAAQEAQVSDIFKGTAQVFPFHRLAADDTSVLAVHALNGSWPSVQLLGNDLSMRQDFIGFRNSVTVAVSTIVQYYTSICLNMTNIFNESSIF